MGHRIHNEGNDLIDIDLDESALRGRTDKIEAFLDEFIEMLDLFLDHLYGLAQDFILQIGSPLNDGQRSADRMEGVSDLMGKKREKFL
jgi:hypothetical protein